MTTAARRPTRVVLAALAVVCALIAMPLSATAATGPSESPTPSTTPTPEPEDPTRAAEYWLEQYGITDAWDETRGKGATIAVIDSGVAADIEELEGAVANGTDVSGVGTPDGRTPLGSDVHTRSHGTWVASLAAARGLGADEGMIGVAPRANLLSVSLGFGAVSEVPFSEQVADAMKWSVDNGADIINLSFTTNQTAWDENWDEAFLYAFEHDVVVIVAAGNRASGTTMVGAPATIPGVLVVGGVHPSGSASHDASTQGVTIGVSAPSEQLLGIGPTGAVEEWRGTSGAAPIVAGVAALVRSAHPGLDANNVINRIVQTADPAPSQQGDRDPIFGFGIIDADEAVTGDVGLVAENPMGDLKEWIRLNRGSDDPSQVDTGASPTPEPIELPALPPPDPPAEASNPLAPSPDSLREVTLPLVAVSAAGILILLGVVAVSRRIRSARESRDSGS
ncbi:S8 family serine peptidase [Microbacterium sp. G2-8]|uniref:S8 family peptidase n=1 Tax=Microbacterium sp. G2-8 TaxID=2842454 RepID=UPI001C8A608B|nr:S8 family serine peptidase [Microbacterium sp. G2-8]